MYLLDKPNRKDESMNNMLMIEEVEEIVAPSAGTFVVGALIGVGVAILICSS